MTGPAMPVFVSYARGTSLDVARALLAAFGEDPCFLEEERAACFAAGMDGVLTKPITAESLRAGLVGLSRP